MKVVKIAALVVTAAVLVGTGIGVAAGYSLATSFGFATAGLGGLVGLSGTALSGVLLAAATIDLGLLASLVKPSSGGSQTKWKADPYAGLPYVMGRTLVSGNIVAKLLKGATNALMGMVTVLSIGPVDAFEASFMNKTTMTWSTDPTNPAGGASATNGFAGYIWEQRSIGSCPEYYAVGGSEGYAGWTSEHKLSGLACVFNTFGYDAKSANGLTSLPSPGWIIRGVHVYDPRLDSTYPGGSGPCRALDESTYVYSENPHLHALTWALGRWQNGVRVAGIGAPIELIDVAAFVEGANLDDARGWKLGGQVYTRPDTMWNSLKSMLQAGGATPVIPGGIISCVNRAPRVSLATITHRDIVGKCSFSGTQSRRTRINGIIPQYRSEANDWELVSAQEVAVADYATMDGGERTKEISYPLVQDVNQVAQLAAYDICDSREAGPGTIPLKPAWMNYTIGDCVTFQPEDGWSVKVIITGRKIDPATGGVTYTVRSETDAKHAFALGQTGVAPPTSSLTYDNPLPTPGADWSLSGATLTSAGGSVAALVVSGAVSPANVEAVAFDYRVYTSGLGDEDGWLGASLEAPTIMAKEITSVTPGTQYQASVRYRVAGVLGPRSIYGPETSGQTYPAGYLQQLIGASYTAPGSVLATGHDTGSAARVTVADHTRVYPDMSVNLSGLPAITGLAYATAYYLYYDDDSRAGGSPAIGATTDQAQAIPSAAHPGRHSLGSITTPAAGAADTTGGGVAI